MVNPTIAQNKSSNDEKIKNFMEKTPALLKSKLLSVLDTSNDLLNRLESSLSLNTSSDNETVSDETIGNRYYDDDSMDENIIDFESRKVKERRAYEEVISGKYRQPTLIARTALNECNIVDINPKSSSSSSSETNFSTTTTPHYDDRSSRGSIDNSDKLLNSEDLDDAIKEDLAHETIEDDAIKEDLGHETIEVDNRTDSPLTSRRGQFHSSQESLKYYIPSESDNSIPSWASSINLDSQTEDETVKFMRNFVTTLFADSSSISLEKKSEFGLQARTETGRMWFSRLVSAQRAKSKRVNESTFYSLIQHFAIVLFECGESEDYSPAKILMNMCFTFYHEIDVPGCEPYQEYLFHYLRAQQIWQSLRFWNAAFFDALQCQRLNRSVPQSSDQISIKSTSTASSSPNGNEDCNSDMLKEEQQFQQNISFGQLGTFTCNMHAFGLSRELCSDFLRKQSVIANLSVEQEKMLWDNINRMYKETAKWRD